MLNLGTVRPGSTIYIPFDSFAGATGASITLTGLAVTDVEVYKDGSMTQRGSDNGYTLLDTDGIDLDGITGIHGLSISLADNSTAGFYAAGSRYWVVISSVTIDAQTVNFVCAYFEIGYPNAVLNTTIATLASQTSFTLTSGPAEDDALNGMWVLIHDVASAVQLGMAIVDDYTGSTKTVTLAAGTTYTAATTDNVAVMLPMPMQPTVAARKLDVSAGGEAGVDWANVGSPTTALALTGTTIATTQKVDLETIKTQAVTAAAGVTFPTSIASPTNITAGTITTATNVTTVNGLAAAVITATSIAGDAITAAKIADGAIDAATFAAGAINAAAIAADAITDAKVAADVTIASVTGAVGSVTGAVGSVTGNVGGNVTGSVGSLAAQAKADVNAEVDSALDTAIPGTPTAGSINDVLKDLDARLPGAGTLSVLSAAAVNAEVVDALAVDTYAEPGQGAPAATTTLAAKINYLYKAWRNKATQTATDYVLYADDGLTTDQKATISDDTTTFTRGEVGTGA